MKGVAKPKMGAPWGAVIALLFLFFPVGIFLLASKISRETFRYTENARVLRILGAVLVALGAFYVISSFAGDKNLNSGEKIADSLPLAATLFVGGGITLLISSFRLREKAVRYARYVAIVNATDPISLDQIAASYPRSYERVCDELQEMLDAGYFKGGTLDLQNRKLRVSSTEPNRTGAGSGPRLVQCPGCGAVQSIAGFGPVECEYCGLPLYSIHSVQSKNTGGTPS